MEKVITAVVTTLICSFLGGEGHKSEISKEEAKKSTQVESFEAKSPSEAKETVNFDSIETSKK